MERIPDIFRGNAHSGEYSFLAVRMGGKPPHTKTPGKVVPGAWVYGLVPCAGTRMVQVYGKNGTEKMPGIKK